MFANVLDLDRKLLGHFELREAYEWPSTGCG